MLFARLSKGHAPLEYQRPTALGSYPPFWGYNWDAPAGGRRCLVACSKA
jgi:hypothetical protein